MINSEITISVVDDDESVRRALKRLLASVGFQVKIFCSAQDFLDYGRFGKSILILDVQMPEINGIELQEILAASEVKIPIIFITAHESPKNFVTAMGAGAVAFLQKPFDHQSLLDAIDRGIGMLRT
jgi:two-component system, LuxR family, response regulator FixJ